MNDNKTHVVLIGIDHYDDGNVSNLHGARHDVIAWWRLCTGHLQVPPDQITVLASPPLSAAELGQGAERSRLKGASREEMIGAMRWLAAAVRGDGEAAGLLTYSGHGVVSGPERTGEAGEDLALCPQDAAFDAGRLDKLLSFSRMAEVFGSEEVRLKVTVVLDTCYTETAADSGPNRRLVGRLRARQAGEHMRDAMAQGERGKKVLALRSADAMSTRLLLASEHWAPAYEIRIDGGWRGAFSWALGVLMEQWSQRQHAGVRYLNVSYRDLTQRAALLLAAMGVPQSPVIWGPRRVDNLALLRPGLDYEPGETSRLPDGSRRGKQIPVDGEHDVTVAYLNHGADFAFVVAVGGEPFSVSGMTFQPNTEYWYLDASADLAALDGCGCLTWVCHYAGDAAGASQAVESGLASFGCAASEHDWTASRTSYAWRAGAPQGFPQEYAFSNGASGIKLGIDGGRLAGVVIYNADDRTTWPDAPDTLNERGSVAFDANATMPAYHYVFDLSANG